MPGLSLHLLSLEAGTGPQSFVQRLRDYPKVKVIVASRPRIVVTRPTHIDVCHLSTTKWDLLVLLQAPNNSIPAVFRPIIRCEYHISVGVPSKLIDNYPELDARLKRTAPSISLTGALGKPQQRKEFLQISPQSLKSMDDLFEEHNKPITMLNLLNFFPRGGKQSYFQYGQAFIPIAEKRGGYTKIVGNVVKSLASSGDSRADRAEQDWWHEISIVHYPSIKHFYDLIVGEDYQAINRQYRLTALRDNLLLCTTEFDVEETHTSKL